MGVQETIDFARNFAVMVRVRGPDPKGVKMRRHAFHQYHSGETILSASGMLMPDTLYDSEAARRVYGHNFEGMVLVVTVASIVEPFLSQQKREKVPQDRPELISGVRIDIMTEETNEESDERVPFWLDAQLLSLVDIPLSALSLQSLIEASFGSPQHGWEVGWSLASNNNDSQQGNFATGGLGSASLMCKSLTRMAILGVSSSVKDKLDIPVSSMNRRGDILLAVGSPFGILLPTHFFNSISVGCIANCYPPDSSDGSLLMADIRCLPGTEGSPVFNEHACLTGILIRPLRQKTSGAEIQLVVPWNAIATASDGLLQKWPQKAVKGSYHENDKLCTVAKASCTDNDPSRGPSSYNHEHSNSGNSSPLPVEKAMASICLVTIDDGVWASGVLLNSQGLILTNAHLLEPWRFRKTHASGGGCENNLEKLPFFLKGATSFGNGGVVGNQNNQTSLSKMETLYPFTTDGLGGYKSYSTYKGNRNIRVRLDHVKPWIWCDAKVVYICKGPWDIALLQLESVPDQLLPIVMNFAWPSVGSKAYVIGHGLFGPRCGFLPSVCSGVVAKVVRAKTPKSYNPIQQEQTFPAMLETTAAVHPGASGGAVINSDGCMIGLVTSNARHGGGTVIPHLNFSIPSAALAPIFKFSQDMQDLSLLQILDEPNEYLSSIWALTRSESPKLPSLPQSLMENDSKERKGSRFAKFIAERKEVFNPPSQVGKSPNMVIPSKL
ncbi:hypothetical protein L6164_036700 [Bauhinia variegata]|uniref:Uncharacterized protein n=1 Tax=Bauhinia variegata TaxID=167791 RepID=A0ACB9KHX1_BAUVA|nr:hypothetical protein L6164_036700 [Bauhinia variegata]